ncbi:MAG: hypothetical protein ACREAB_18340 [Blastocatellia bacterium]
MLFTQRNIEQIAATIRPYSIFLLLVAWLIPITAGAQSGVSLLAENLYDFNGAAGAYATAAPVTITGQPFTQAYRVAVNRTSANVSDAGLWFRTTQPVNQGDKLQLTFWVRKIAPLDGIGIQGHFNGVTLPATTNETGAVDAAGKFTARGYKGSYNVTAVYQRVAQTIPATIDANGEITITLDTVAPRPAIRRDRAGQVDQQIRQ